MTANDLAKIAATWHKARNTERALAISTHAEIVTTVGEGMTEVEAARVAGVDRMTVRRALGKRKNIVDKYTTEKVSTARFVEAYQLDADYDYLRHLASRKASLTKQFKKQNVSSSQAWLDSWARIVHETSQKTSDDPIIFVCDVDEFDQWVARTLAD